jgi:spermidine synthase
MNELSDGWFSEISPMWDGVALSIEVEERLFSEQSEFQRIDVYKTRACGNMLVLDGIIQATELDEFAYQEMLTHIPMCAHPDPKRVLVIGGGDGGVLREIARHDCVEKIDICEIDAKVVEASKRFLPAMAVGFDDPRVNLHIADGSEFIKGREGAYDVIIVDSSDPIGPGEALFQSPFYEKMKSALKPDGVIGTQGESFMLHGDVVKSLMDVCSNLFTHAAYAYMLVPTYPGGHIGTCVCGMNRDPREPARTLPDEVMDELRYYNREIHKAAFVMPQFAKKLLTPAN